MGVEAKAQHDIAVYKQEGPHRRGHFVIMRHDWGSKHFCLLVSPATSLTKTC